MPNELALIDLSSIAYPIWHQSQSEPDPDRTSQQVVARVYALTTEHRHAAICCDAGRSFRHDITPTYKATRPEHDALAPTPNHARQGAPPGRRVSRLGRARALKPTTSLQPRRVRRSP